MKKTIFFATVIILLCVFFISSCDGVVTGDYKNFESKLRGTWVSNDPGIYSGTLIITYDTITIDGYGESQTPQNGDDSQRPFKGIPKGKQFKGYSEDGMIFFSYGDAAQNGIPYIYTAGGNYQNEFKILEFTFGDRKEILEYKTGY